MDRKKIILSIIAVILLISSFFIMSLSTKEDEVKTKSLEITVISNKNKQLIAYDQNNIIYTFNDSNITDVKNGDRIIIEYTGLINKNKEIQNLNIINHKITKNVNDEKNIPIDWNDQGIFSDYYILAYDKLKDLTLDEKIAQLLLVRYPDNNGVEILKNNQFGGYIFFAKDFKNKTSDEVKQMIKELQDVSKIPILTAVDEEGGTVNRVSSNPNLVSEKFKSPSELYNLGGFEKIKEDTINKSNILNNLGLNLNLAPVVDVSTNPNDYIYNRTIKQNSEITSTYAKTVIQASKNTGVSYTLKHFPGYGSAGDSHQDIIIDNTSYNDLMQKNIPPFKEGINAKAEAILVNHNIISSIDSNNPASLSISVHNLLRNELAFTGITITDDLNMSALDKINDKAVKSILAGNDIIITSDYENDFAKIKQAVNNGTISTDIIDKLAFRVISWKYYKGLMYENQK